MSLVFMLGLFVHSAVGGDASATVSQGAAPKWKRVVHLQDGRTFVSDGPFALDAALAKPDVDSLHPLPEASTKAVETYLHADLPENFAFTQLTRSPDSSKYTAPQWGNAQRRLR